MLKKRWVQILLALFVVLFLLLLSLPFIINVDSYRPQLLAKINEQINGEVKLEKISLSLLGQIKFGLNKLQVLDANKVEMVSADSSEAVIPVSSLLAFKPALVIKLDGPKIYVKRDKNGKINLLSLIKEGGPKPTEPKPEEKPAGSKDLPQWVKDARLSIAVKNGDVQVDDEILGLKQKIQNFELNAKNLGVGSNNEIEMSTLIDTKMKDIRANGKIVAQFAFTPEMANGELSKLDATAQLDMSDLDLAYAKLFHKSNKIPFTFKTKMSYTGADKTAKISDANLVFHTLKMGINASHKDGMTTASVDTNNIDFAGWEPLIPLVKGISGKGKISANVSKGASLSYSANVEVENVKAQMEGVPGDISVNSKIKIKTDEIEQLTATIMGPETDIDVVGSIVGFTKPNINFKVASKKINLDKIIPPPPANAKPEPSVAAAPPPPSADPNAPTADPTAAVNEVKKNSIVANTKANILVDIGEFSGRGISATNIHANAIFADLKLDLKDLRMNLFNGKVSGLFGLDLAPALPSYKMGLAVDKMDISKATAAKLPEYKDTIFGLVSFKVAGIGTGLDPKNILKTLRVQGDFAVTKAVLQTVDAIKMTKEALQGSVAKLEKVLPNANLNALDKLDDEKSEYEKISANYTLKNGIMSMPNFAAVAVKNRGLDITGDTEIDLLTDKIKAEWRVVDTYNRTKAQDISIKQSGIEIDNIFGDKKGLVSLPIIVGCKLTKPCYKYDKVFKDLEEKALDNIKKKAGKQVTAKVKQEVKAKAKKIEKEVKKELKGKAKDKAKDLMKKIGL